MNELELLNTDGLDESISNAIGCGLPPICSNTKIVRGTRRECKKVLGKEICINVPTLKTVTNQECVDKKKAHSDCVAREGNLISNLGKGVQQAAQNVGSGIKTAATSVSSGVKNVAQQTKKKIVSLKQKVGAVGKKFRNKFRSILRKDILFKIKNNIHGTAVKTYPAIATDAEVKKSRFKVGYVPKSKNVYNQLLAQWKKLGGTKEELDSAIRQGATKRRFAKNPYKSFNGWNDSYAFYTNLSNADGEEEIIEEEIPTEEEKQKGIRGFFAWFLGLFKRNNANENPYEEGTAEAGEYGADANEDKGNEPTEAEANSDVMNEIMGTASGDDAGGSTDEAKASESEEGAESEDDGKILGIPKTGFWIGVGVLGVAAIGLTIYALRKK